MSHQKQQTSPVKTEKPKPIQSPVAGTLEAEQMANLVPLTSTGLFDRPEPMLRSIKQTQLLQMQRQFGNSHVQRFLQNKTARTKPATYTLSSIQKPVQTKRIQRQPMSGVCPTCGKSGPVEEECPDCGNQFTPMQGETQSSFSEETILPPETQQDSMPDAPLTTPISKENKKGVAKTSVETPETKLPTPTTPTKQTATPDTTIETPSVKQTTSTISSTNEGNLDESMPKISTSADDPTSSKKPQTTLEATEAIDKKASQLQSDPSPFTEEVNPTSDETVVVQRQPISVQRTIGDSLQNMLGDILNKVRELATGRVSEIESTAETEAATLTDKSDTKAEKVESQGQTDTTAITSQAETDTARVETQASSHEQTLQGEGENQASLVAQQTEAETTNVQTQAEQEKTDLDTETTNANAQLTEQADGEVSTVESDWTTLEGETTVYLSDVNQQASETWTGVQEEANNVTTTIQASEQALAEETKQAIPQVQKEAKGVLGQLRSEAISILSEANPKSGEDLTSLDGSKASLMGRAMAALGDLQTVVSPLTERIQAGWENLKALAESAWERVKGLAGSAWATVKTLGSTAWQTIQSGWTGLEGFANNVWQGLAKNANNFISGLTTAAGKAWNQVRGMADTALSNLSGLVTSAQNGIKNLGSSLVDSLTETVATTWGSLKGKAQGAVQSLKGLAASVFGNLKGETSRAEGGVENKKGSAISAVQSLASSFLDKIGSVLGNLKSRAGNALSGLKGQGQTALNTLQQRDNQALTSLQTNTNQSVTMMKGQGDTAIASLNTQTNRTFSTLQSRNTASQNQLNTQTTGLLGWVQNAGRNAVKGVKNAWSGLKGRTSSFWTSITKRASQTWQTFQNSVNQTWQGLQNGWLSLKGLASQAWQRAEKGLEGTKKQVGSLKDSISNDWLGFIGRANGLWTRAKGTEAGEAWNDIQSEAQMLAQDAVFFKARSHSAETIGTAQQIQRQLGSGRPLDSRTRQRMEGTFGYSFSGVRIHTDAKAVQLSRQSNARAFAVGKNIAFDSGEYNPGTPIGDALLAHELAHVVQQDGATVNAPLAKGQTHDSPIEIDADRSAIGAVVSLWSNGKIQAKDITQNAMPRLRTGLRLSRCSSCGGGTIDAPANAELVSRANALVQGLCQEGCNVTYTAGQRSQATAHKWSTAFFIQQGEISISNVTSSLTANGGEYRDEDGNLWYTDGWTQEQFDTNARELWPSGNLAFEGYEVGNSKRAPNTTDVPVSRHTLGEAIDIAGIGDCDSDMVSRLLQQHQLAQPLSCEPWHLERADYENQSPEEMCSRWKQ